MSKLPKGWKSEKLGVLCKFENGDRGKNYPSRESFVSNGIPFINAGNLKNFRIDETDLSYITKTLFYKLSNGKFKKGDILFCLRGSLGKYAVIDKDFEGAIASSLIIIRVSNELSVYFLSAYLQSALCAEMIALYDNGSAQPNLSAANLKKFIIPLPPLPEQTRIVNKLDALFARIDKSIALLEENIQHTQALMASVLEKTFNELKNEKHLTIDDLSVIVTKGSSPTWQGIKYTNSPEDVLFITSENVGSYSLLLDNKKYLEMQFNQIQPRSILKKGDILMNIVGASIGRTAMYDLEINANINQAVCLIRLNQAKIDLRYALHYFNSTKCISLMFENQVDNARANLSMGNIKKFLIPLPSLEIQKKISLKLDNLRNRNYAILTEQQSKLTHLKALKESLLDKAFKGEL